MNRDNIINNLLKLPNNNILLEFPTGLGKTRAALELMKSRVSPDSKILIVVPRLVLINTWREEIRKWKCREYNVEFVTYVSFPKKAGVWDMVIFDEVHHLSQRCRDSLLSYTITYSTMLSATVSRDMKWILKALFKNLYIEKIYLREAIDNNVLPDPKVFLWELELDNKSPEYVMAFNKGKNKSITCLYSERWKYLKDKSYTVHVKCTSKEYLTELNRQIEFWKGKYMRTRGVFTKTKWLRLCKDRLTWLAMQKTQSVSKLLKLLSNKRTITFCANIEQTYVLGKNCINSKNKMSQEYLALFNEKKIKHITACDMLNEGINLSDCKIGIFAVLNGSELMTLQKMGRILRHSEPVIIVPYYRGTREEDLVKRMVENYNEKLITKVERMEDICIK